MGQESDIWKEGIKNWQVEKSLLLIDNSKWEIVYLFYYLQSPSCLLNKNRFYYSLGTMLKYRMDKLKYGLSLELGFV